MKLAHLMLIVLSAGLLALAHGKKRHQPPEVLDLDGPKVSELLDFAETKITYGLGYLGANSTRFEIQNSVKYYVDWGEIYTLEGEITVELMNSRKRYKRVHVKNCHIQVLEVRKNELKIDEDNCTLPAALKSGHPIRVKIPTDEEGLTTDDRTAEKAATFAVKQMLKEFVPFGDGRKPIDRLHQIIAASSKEMPEGTLYKIDLIMKQLKRPYKSRPPTFPPHIWNYKGCYVEVLDLAESGRVKFSTKKTPSKKRFQLVSSRCEDPDDSAKQLINSMIPDTKSKPIILDPSEQYIGWAAGDGVNAIPRKQFEPVGELRIWKAAQAQLVVRKANRFLQVKAVVEDVNSSLDPRYSGTIDFPLTLATCYFTMVVEANRVFSDERENKPYEAVCPRAKDFLGGDEELVDLTDSEVTAIGNYAFNYIRQEVNNEVVELSLRSVNNVTGHQFYESTLIKVTLTVTLAPRTRGRGLRNPENRPRDYECEVLIKGDDFRPSSIGGIVYRCEQISNASESEIPNELPPYRPRKPWWERQKSNKRKRPGRGRRRL